MKMSMRFLTILAAMIAITPAINADQLKSIEPSPVSMMSPGLIASMKDDDILDLLAYLISSGNPDHELFEK